MLAVGKDSERHKIPGVMEFIGVKYGQKNCIGVAYSSTKSTATEYRRTEFPSLPLNATLKCNEERIPFQTPPSAFPYIRFQIPISFLSIYYHKSCTVKD